MDNIKLGGDEDGGLARARRTASVLPWEAGCKLGQGPGASGRGQSFPLAGRLEVWGCLGACMYRYKPAEPASAI